jgi:nucleoside-diphosphate-sugar epimerase
MRKEVVLITGANGEIGHGLINQISADKHTRILAMDLKPIDECLEANCERFIQGDILDKMLLGRLMAEYEITTIYHLASILSTKAEYNPVSAHEINVEGTINLLRLGVELSQWQGKPVKFIYPSSIAVYGLPDKETKVSEGKLKEYQWCDPITMYGCNKIYCEHLGRYYSRYYRQLAKDPIKNTIDFRCIRFPGLISADTTPTGGTSDYGPEMLHSAAKSVPYECFVRKDTRIPFMAMPDAIKALLLIEKAPFENFSQLVYNVTSFSPSAEEIEGYVKNAFPKSEISYEVHNSRQAIVDSWPEDVDDSPARKDWDWKPDYDMARSFNEYLIPAIRARYSQKGCN